MKFAIRRVLWLLVEKKGVSNFWPLTIVGKGDEETRLVVFPCNDYYTLTVLVLISGLPMKDGDRMTFLPDMISSGLLAVVKSTQLTNQMISGQEATCQSAAWIGPGQFSCY